MLKSLYLKFRRKQLRLLPVDFCFSCSTRAPKEARALFGKQSDPTKAEASSGGADVTPKIRTGHQE